MKFDIKIDYTRDGLLTPFAKSLLRQYYIKDRKTYQEFFATVAGAYSDTQEQAQYMYDIISKLYFCPATPTLANAIYCGTNNTTHLPISCYLNSIQNNKESIAEAFQETMRVSLADGGLGTNFSHVAAAGDYMENKPSLGCIPPIKAQSLLLRNFGGPTREYGSGAAYLHISHPEIEAFIDMRKPAVGADQEMKVPRYMHHGVIITQEFLNAVKEDGLWSLRSVTTNKEVKALKARELWKKILITRIETGEPFLIFIDNVNNQRPEILKKLQQPIEMSNLCTEIVLPTGIDYLGNERTAICCLGSINLKHYDIWKQDSSFFDHIGTFLDNVRLDFIARAPATMSRAVYATKRDGSIGLGVSGYSTYLQSKMIPLESEEANVCNKDMFRHIKEGMDAISYKLACMRGACEDGEAAGIMERFTHKIALKPDALTAFIFNVSPNTEATPVSYVYKTLHGSHLIKNCVFEDLLVAKNQNNEEVWNSVTSTGSVNHLTFLTEREKEVFKNAYQTNPLVIVRQAADRQPYICQAASLNIRTYLPVKADVLNEVHMLAASLGIKTMYYLEAKSQFNIENNFTSSNKTEETFHHQNKKISSAPKNLGDVCVGCD